MAILTDRYKDVGPGWAALLTMLHAELAEILPDYELVQVKEKFGGLRVYINHPEGIAPFHHPAYYLINRYEILSMRTCEYCGKQGVNEQGPSSWFKTLCEVHRERWTAEGPMWKWES